MSSDTERDLPDARSARDRPGDTERDLESPAADEASAFRVIPGGRSARPDEEAQAGSSKPIDGAAFDSDARQPIDKSRRPAHLQLREITIPPWLPWVAQLMQQMRAQFEGIRSGGDRSSKTSGASDTSKVSGLVVGIFIGMTVMIVGVVLAIFIRTEDPPGEAPAAPAVDAQPQASETAPGNAEAEAESSRQERSSPSRGESASAPRAAPLIKAGDAPSPPSTQKRPEPSAPARSRTTASPASNEPAQPVATPPPAPAAPPSQTRAPVPARARPGEDPTDLEPPF